MNTCGKETLVDMEILDEGRVIRPISHGPHSQDMDAFLTEFWRTNTGFVIGELCPSDVPASALTFQPVPAPVPTLTDYCCRHRCEYVVVYGDLALDCPVHREEALVLATAAHARQMLRWEGGDAIP